MPKQKILLHTCCAPCATACIERLAAGREAVLFSATRTSRQRASTKRLEEAPGRDPGPEMREDSYDHQAWLEHVRGWRTSRTGKRCSKCFAFSLARTAAQAELMECRLTTTPSVSRHKSSPEIFSVAVPLNVSSLSTSRRKAAGSGASSSAGIASTGRTTAA